VQIRKLKKRKLRRKI